VIQTQILFGHGLLNGNGKNLFKNFTNIIQRFCMKSFAYSNIIDQNVILEVIYIENSISFFFKEKQKSFFKMISLDKILFVNFGVFIFLFNFCFF